MRYLSAFLILLSWFGTANATNFTLITMGGYVSFSTDDNWKVIAMDTKRPQHLQVAAFQIPMPGEEDNNPPTNASISLLYPSSPEVSRSLELIGKPYGPIKPKEGELNGWRTYRQVVKNGGMEFVIVDAKNNIADVLVAVRFAWPRKQKTDIEKMLSEFLASVSGGLGPYKPKDGEVIRRPIK